MRPEVTDDAERVQLRTAVVNYCERDTLAMVELRKVLYSTEAN